MLRLHSPHSIHRTHPPVPVLRDGKREDHTRQYCGNVSPDVRTLSADEQGISTQTKQHGEGFIPASYPHI